MAQAADHTVGVCLYKLDAREEAVLKRVVSFSGAQGRNYALADLAAAHLVVVSNDTVMDLAAMHPQGAMLIRIADQDSEQPYDLLMQRPLLVTRVMRTLDEARKLWADSCAESVSKPAGELVHLSVVESASAEPIAETQVPIEPSTPLVEEVQNNSPTVTELSTAQPTTVGNETVLEAKQEIQVEAPSVIEPESLVVLTEQSPPPTQKSTPTTEAPTELAGGDYHHRALVVDDSAAIRKQLELELRQAGIVCDFAETGEEALQKVATHTYDLVFLDIIMPGIDGYEACRQMRMRKEMKKTPIIMLSAKTSPLDEVQGVIAGASTYLTKPVKSDQLQKTLKRVAMWLDNFQQARS